MLTYYRSILKRAFTQSLGPIDLWTGVAAALLGILDHLLPQAQLMTAYGWQIPILALAAVIAVRLVLAPYWIQREKTQRLSELEEQIRQKLKLSFSMNDPQLVIPNARIVSTALSPALHTSAVTTIGNSTLVPTGAGLSAVPTRFIRATWFRIKVETDGVAHVAHCCGRLEWIKSGTTFVLVEPTLLTFTRAEEPDTVDKTVHSGAPEFLDFLYISEANKVGIPSYKGAGSSAIDWENLFAQPGVYTIQIKVLSREATATIELQIAWTGDCKTAEVKCLAKR